ncbi:MAG: hypothetical protein ABSH36_07375 [Solirubrobacteraceae bacterium]
MRTNPFAIVFLLFLALSASAQQEPRRERTIGEIKTEAIHRAEVGQYPLIGLDPADVKEAFETIHTPDKDEWAAGFMRVADRYFNEAKSLEKSDPAKANADYTRAWRLYSFGRWPIPASPGKQRSYEMALEAFLDHARFFDPPLEVVHIPFEGKEIAFGVRLKARLPSKRVPDAVERWLRHYQSTREEGEAWGDFVQRVGTPELEGLVKDLSLPVEFGLETMGQFIDWNRNVPFEVIRGEGECAV